MKSVKNNKELQGKIIIKLSLKSIKRGERNSFYHCVLALFTKEGKNPFVAAYLC